MPHRYSRTSPHTVTPHVPELTSSSGATPGASASAQLLASSSHVGRRAVWSALTQVPLEELGFPDGLQAFLFSLEFHRNPRAHTHIRTHTHTLATNLFFELAPPTLKLRFLFDTFTTLARFFFSLLLNYFA